MDIKAAVTHAQAGDFVLESVALAEPQGGVVLVRVVASGVCHPDEVARELGLSPFPVVLGHEGSGVIEKLGPNVPGLEVGDHVVMSFAHCGSCGTCLPGHPTVCETFNDLYFGGVMDDCLYRLCQVGQGVSTFFGLSSFVIHVVCLVF